MALPSTLITKAEQGIEDPGTVDRSFPAIVHRLERYAMLLHARSPDLGLLKPKGQIELQLPVFREREDRWFVTREKLNEYILLYYPSDRREFEFQIATDARQWLYRAASENLRMLDEIRNQSLQKSGLLDLQMTARMFMDALEAHLQRPPVQTKTSDVAEAITAEIDFDREIVEQSNNDVLKLLFRSARGLQHRHIFKNIAEDKEKARGPLENLFKRAYEGIHEFRGQLTIHDLKQDYFWRYEPAIAAALGNYSNNPSLYWFTLKVIAPEKSRGFFDRTDTKIGLAFLTAMFIIMGGPVAVALAAGDFVLWKMYDDYIQERRKEMTNRASLFGLGKALPVQEEHNYWAIGAITAISLIGGYLTTKYVARLSIIAGTKTAEAVDVMSSRAIKKQSMPAEAPTKTTLSESMAEAKVGHHAETKVLPLDESPSHGGRMIQRGEAEPLVTQGERQNLRPIQGEDRALKRGVAVEETPQTLPKTGALTKKPASPATAEGPAHPPTQQQLDNVIENQVYAEYLETSYNLKDKTVAWSEGNQAISGQGARKIPMDLMQEMAPAKYANEAEYYTLKYKELSGIDPPPGRDTRIRGDQFATHAEVKDRIIQFNDGTNNSTGVSKDMCGNCRLWHQNTAKKQGIEILISDPNYIRKFNPDGTVDIYTFQKEFIKTVTADVPPSATGQNYVGIDW